MAALTVYTKTTTEAALVVSSEKGSMHLHNGNMYFGSRGLTKCHLSSKDSSIDDLGISVSSSLVGRVVYSAAGSSSSSYEDGIGTDAKASGWGRSR